MPLSCFGGLGVDPSLRILEAGKLSFQLDHNMSFVIHILTEMVLPIFVMIGVGYITGRKFKLDIGTLSKLNLYVFVPAFIFARLYSTDLPGGRLLKIAAFGLLMVGSAYLVAEVVSRVLHFRNPMTRAFANSIMFYNSGNYGVPLIDLVFKGDPNALAVQTVILMCQNILTNSVGVLQASFGSGDARTALRNVARMPSIYAIPVALCLNYLDVKVPSAILTPAQYLANGLVPIALVTLGIQLSRIGVRLGQGTVLASNMLRLVGGPLIAAALVRLLGFDAFTSRVLMVSSCVPTAVNTSLIAIEFKNEPEFASSAAFSCTLLSLVTVTAVVYLVL